MFSNTEKLSSSTTTATTGIRYDCWNGWVGWNSWMGWNVGLFKLMEMGEMVQLLEIPKLVEMGEWVDCLDWLARFICLNGWTFVYMPL